ncbi:hypothetical protein SAMN05443574_101104 [Haloarcula vallismortis]|uniref:Uncharacterized protein n=2 Tax=Haloarcula vallismortis TaxID=28442 RepID=M0IX98_HALVA|nr:hypothetical protein [Haloarcula vallismortis]EMA00683.1 hypothetical protein C437_17822 [Haloarcula vallismortis ATCC 29715]SDW03060.1 hypothetical protein SAMN05443574_101104 [Haloarcula vallismortis]
MDEKSVALVGVLLLLFSGGVAAYVTGTGPFQAASSDEDISAVPMETTEVAETDATGGDSNPSASGAASSPPFDFTVGAVEECSRTCRDVTSTLTNQQNSTAESITVYTRIYAGNTTDGDAVWEGSEDVGRLESKGSYTTTRRVDLSFGDAYAIEQADGWITIRTTVETADRTVTLSEQRKVA